MEAAAELPAWLRALEPLSVPVVVVLTVVAVWIERRRDAERRRRYDARMRANAYELMILLVDWRVRWPMWAHPEVEEPPPDVEEVVRFARTIADDAEAARGLGRQLVMDAPASSDSLARMAKEVYPRVASVTVLFGDLCEGPPLNPDREAEWVDHNRHQMGIYRRDYLDRAADLLEGELDDFAAHSRW